MFERKVLWLLSLVATLATLVLGQDDLSASTAVTTRVSVASDGTQSNGTSYAAAMSADGRFVAFYSEATNLVSGDTALCDMNFDGEANENCGDIFIRDLESGLTELVTVNSQEVQANDGSGSPTISADGRFVTFLSLASNLVNADTNNDIDVFIRDRALGVTERVSLDSNELEANGHWGEATVNSDGRFVAFESCGWSETTPGHCALSGSSVASHIYVRDRQGGTTTRVSVNSAGVDGNRDSFDPDISDDGRFVTFHSRASNLVPNDTNTCVEFPTAGQCEDVFVHDRVTGTTERINVADSGAQGNRPSQNASITGEGRFVAFQSRATNLVDGDTNGMTDVFVKDRLMGTLRRVGHNALGEELDGPSVQPSLSDSGRYLVFLSGATNVVPGDTNYCGSDVPPSCEDVFVRDTLTQITVRASVSSAGAQAPAASSSPTISSNGRQVSFVNWAPLVPDDTNGYEDIFVHNLGDSDNDGEWDPFDACPTNADCDDDGFADGAEMMIGTYPLAACGTDAWPADIDNDGFSDITDVVLMLNHFGLAVPPAPVRHNIAPDPPDGFVDITDIVRIVAYFGQGCG